MWTNLLPRIQPLYRVPSPNRYTTCPFHTTKQCLSIVSCCLHTWTPSLRKKQKLWICYFQTWALGALSLETGLVSRLTPSHLKPRMTCQNVRSLPHATSTQSCGTLLRRSTIGSLRISTLSLIPHVCHRWLLLPRLLNRSYVSLVTTRCGLTSSC